MKVENNNNVGELFRDNQCLRDILMEKDVQLPYIKLEVMSESQDENCKGFGLFSYYCGVPGEWAGVDGEE